MKEKGETELASRAEKLKNTLMPRMGGVLAMLEKNDELKNEDKADVIFCVNYGLDKVRSFWELLKGVMFNQTVDVELWRVKKEDIPNGVEERTEWMYQHWIKMDAWVEERKNKDREEIARKKKK